MTREAKIKRYMEQKELKEKLSTLSKAMSNLTADDETKRSYFTTMLQSYVSQALDELNSIDQEKPILEYMAKNAGGMFLFLFYFILIYRFFGALFYWCDLVFYLSVVVSNVLRRALINIKINK